MVAKQAFPEYLEVVTKALESTAPGCKEAVVSAVQEVNKMLGTRVGARRVSKLFRLCKAFNGKEERDTGTLIGRERWCR